MAKMFSLAGKEQKDSLVLYNYPEITINKNEASPTSISISYKIVENLIRTKNGSTVSYVAQRLNIYKGTNFKIEGVSDSAQIEGEIVITHSRLNNNDNNQTVYSVFFLTTSNVTNELDNLIGMIDKTNDKTSSVVNLNNYVPTQTSGCIFYTDKNLNEYYIFCVPIQIKSKLSSGIFVKNPLTTIVDYSKYFVIKYNGILNQTTNVDQIYIDCNPTGESDETIKTYNLPINSGLMSDLQKNDLIKMILNFCIFSIGIVFCYFGLPLLNNFVIGIKFENQEKYLGFIPLYSSQTGNNFILYYMAGILFLLSIYILIMGFATQNYVMTGLGLLFFLMYAFSSALLSKPEYDKETLRRTGNLKEYLFIGETRVMNYITFFVMFITLLVLLSMYLTGTMKSDSENPFKTATNEFIFLFIFLILFVGPFLSFSYAVASTQKYTPKNIPPKISPVK